MWGGRFEVPPDAEFARFNSSLAVDKRMWREDLAGSRAYAAAIGAVGIISPEEVTELQGGLDALRKQWEEGGGAAIDADVDEDIHSAHERLLGSVVAPTLAARLHTGRSRNDQVLTDFRMWLRAECDAVTARIHTTIRTLVERAAADIDLLMPGYTHMQRAQPIRWSHFLLSYAWALRRDAERFADARKRVDVCPLGSGALAGHPFGIDRPRLAAALGFSGGAAPNSLDAVASRDFVCEVLSAAAACGVTLSRAAEDLILYATAEFGFVRLADAYSTGSSLMPQKKNPDSLELIRGRSARLCGAAAAALMVTKALPSTYNKDLQDDKALTFDALDSLSSSLSIFGGVVATLRADAARMRAALSDDLLATDLADYLVRKAVPFRQAHHMVGAAVKAAEAAGVPLSRLPLDKLREIAPAAGEDVAEVWDFEKSVERRCAVGGTARSSVEAQIAQLRAWLPAAPPPAAAAPPPAAAE